MPLDGMNVGNGACAALVSFRVDSDPTSVLAADLNGDGKPDLTI